jgi:mannose-6-phosphate isomerase-like protein (cupin superfamily)
MLSIRRVVTGHDSEGKAIVVKDEISKNVISGRKGANSTVVWSTGAFPTDNSSDADDGGARSVATTDPNGTVFRIVQYEPGVAPRVHRTDSVDYAVVMAGEIDMELDDGVVVHLKQGDVVVQRGTIHNWVNRGTAPCVIAFSLVAARPVIRKGRALNAMG